MPVKNSLVESIDIFELITVESVLTRFITRVHKYRSSRFKNISLSLRHFFLWQTFVLSFGFNGRTVNEKSTQDRNEQRNSESLRYFDFRHIHGSLVPWFVVLINVVWMVLVLILIFLLRHWSRSTPESVRKAEIWYVVLCITQVILSLTEPIFQFRFNLSDVNGLLIVAARLRMKVIQIVFLILGIFNIELLFHVLLWAFVHFVKVFVENFLKFFSRPSWVVLSLIIVTICGCCVIGFSWNLRFQLVQHRVGTLVRFLPIWDAKIFDTIHLEHSLSTWLVKNTIVKFRSS